MIDVELVDRWFEAGYESGTLILFSLFDLRVIVPLSQMADMLADRCGAATTPDDIRQFARAGWLRLEPRSENEGDVGAPMYVVERIPLFKALQLEGWGQVELRDYAEFEDAMVASFADDDDGFLYIDDDLDQLIQHYRALIEAIGRSEKRDANGNLVGDDADLAHARKQLAFMERLKVTGVPPAMKKNIAKGAFRVRAYGEVARVMIVEDWRAQLRAGFTINVAFNSVGSSAGENGERIFTHGKLSWPRTVRSAYGASEGHDADPIIRVPGFVLCGDRVMTTKTVRPHDYERMWRETDIDGYLAAWAEIRGRPMCMNCFARLPEPNTKNARFCSQKCRDAAKSRRYRESNPESAARAQVKYRASIAEDE